MEVRKDRDEDDKPDPHPGSGLAFRPSEGSSSFKIEIDDEASSGHQEPFSLAYPRTSGLDATSRTFDTETFNTSTRSLYEGDLDYFEENGRRYCGDYFMPNDELEQTRLHIMHQVVLFLLSSRLTSVPLPAPDSHEVTKILDIGTGTGDWAIGIGELYPSARVIGTDISAIQPTSIPHNVSFEIFDAETDEEWTSPTASCDLIHFRNMSGSFYSWNLLYRRTLEHLKPGGWIEIFDCDTAPSSLFEPDAKIHAWWLAVSEALTATGRDFASPHLSVPMLRAVGFTDVKITEHEIPLGVWPQEEDAKSTARLWLVAVLEGLEALSLRLLTGVGWEAEEVKRVCGLVGQELRKVAFDNEVRGAGLGIMAKVLVGRKPLDGEVVLHDEEADATVAPAIEAGGSKKEEREKTQRQFLQIPHEDRDRSSEDTMTPERDAT